LTLPERVEELRGQVVAALGSFLEPREPTLLYRMMRYHLGWEDAQGRPQPGPLGKALRPILCLLTCEALGGRWEQALPAAVALELVHNFSLVHDDIQDQDRERRHRLTVWAIWGQGQAINAGDALLALAQEALARLPEAGVPPERGVVAVSTLARATLEMVEGQVMDLQFEDLLDITTQAYLEMVRRKTGALFAAALSLGAICATPDTQVWEAMGRAGRQLGVAFQIKDDVLGIWGDPSRTGKPAGADIRRRKKSLPIVYALETEGPQRETVVAAYTIPTVDEEMVQRVMQALEEVEARRRSLTLAHELLQEAMDTLSSLPLAPGPRQELEAVVSFLVEREY
jgi:geranylgeranyl diphosphate synthase, type I